MKIILKSPKDF